SCCPTPSAASSATNELPTTALRVHFIGPSFQFKGASILPAVGKSAASGLRAKGLGLTNYDPCRGRRQALSVANPPPSARRPPPSALTAQPSALTILRLVLMALGLFGAGALLT